ncbi:TonB-dependent receptor [Dongia soli]|uniref:TonB-dependent siderophore receptor n=1 Tax=Dongia soli TaxID=600628 RepID=A0ABU5E5K2_9PROT|nr:TonB-dependent siderophore receptor [Dongia soli]MDY0881578.1 TonB-dependent siderophore receptor [Dongia soli]
MGILSKTGKGVSASTDNLGGIRGLMRSGMAPVAGSLASVLVATGAAAQSAPAATNNNQINLPSVQVDADQNKEESTDYKTTSPKLDRLPTDLLDTPQTIVVIPQEIVKEQNVTTLKDSLRNVSGITFQAGEGGTQGDAINIRGFSARNDIFRDGVRDNGWYTRDMFNTEATEVYMGPSSILFGRGSTGGAINMVTKEAKEGSFIDTTLTGGTTPLGRLTLDVNHEFSEKFQVRLNAMGQYSEVPDRDVVQDNRWGVAPSIRIAPSEKTTITLDYLYQGEDSIPDYGVPFLWGKPAPVKRSNFYGIEDSDTTRVAAHVGTARIEHELTDEIKLANTLRYSSVDRFSRPTPPSVVGTPAKGTPLDDIQVQRRRFQTETDYWSLVNQTNLQANFDTGFLSHSLVAGLEASREDRDQGRHNINGTPNTNLADPSHNDDFDTTKAPKTANDTKLTDVALYISDQVKIGEYVEVLGGFRWDRYSTDFHSVNHGTGERVTLSQTDNIYSYRGGLVLHPSENSSVYAMYGTSANPSSEFGTLSDGTVDLDPEKNNVYEIGGKIDLFDARLGLNASVFRVDKTNARVAEDPDVATSPQVLDGKQRVQGVAAGITGRIAEDWQIFANYTFMKSKIRKTSDEDQLGNELTNTPEHSFSLWTSYQIIDGLTVGGGATFQSGVYTNADNTNKVPSFWRFDAMASYDWNENMGVQLNVYNLTNELYYAESAGSRAVPAAGRSASLTAHLRF